MSPAGKAAGSDGGVAPAATSSRPGLEGSLTVFPLSDVLQLEHRSRFTGSLTVTRDDIEVTRVGAKGRIFMQDGEVVHAEVGDLQGQDGFREILAWTTGSFVAHANVTTATSTIAKRFDHLLLDAHVQNDEERSGARALRPRTRATQRPSMPPVLQRVGTAPCVESAADASKLPPAPRKQRRAVHVGAGAAVIVVAASAPLLYSRAGHTPTPTPPAIAATQASRPAPARTGPVPAHRESTDTATAPAPLPPPPAAVHAPPPAPAEGEPAAAEPGMSKRKPDARNARDSAASSKPTRERAAPPRAAPPKYEARVAQAELDRPAFDDGVLEATLEKYSASFAACAAQAHQDEPGIALRGRRVIIMMKVNPDGRPAYPTLDDVALNGTEFGKCLKRVSGKMVFPAFAGESIRARVPLTLK